MLWDEKAPFYTLISIWDRADVLNSMRGYHICCTFQEKHFRPICKGLDECHLCMAAALLLSDGCIFALNRCWRDHFRGPLEKLLWPQFFTTAYSINNILHFLPNQSVGGLFFPESDQFAYSHRDAKEGHTGGAISCSLTCGDGQLWIFPTVKFLNLNERRRTHILPRNGNIYITMIPGIRATSFLSRFFS